MTLAIENPTWTTAILGSTGYGENFHVADIDGDGDLDLLTCEEVHDLGVFWYENPTRH